MELKSKVLLTLTGAVFLLFISKVPVAQTNNTQPSSGAEITIGQEEKYAPPVTPPTASKAEKESDDEGISLEGTDLNEESDSEDMEYQAEE